MHDTNLAGATRANSLEENWMPFTGNRDFKENPRLIISNGRGHRLARHQLTGRDRRHKYLAYLGLQGCRLRPFEMVERVAHVACPFPPFWHYNGTSLCS